MTQASWTVTSLVDQQGKDGALGRRVDWCDVCSNAIAAPVCCGQEEAELKGDGHDLPVDTHPPSAMIMSFVSMQTE